MFSNSYFFDTSALFKRYVAEQGTANVESIFTGENERLISEITLCETVANLRRLVDIEKFLTEDDFLRVKNYFLGEISDGKMSVVSLTTPVLLQSLEICSKQYVAPLDSIQLASALSLSEKPTFVCADHKLLRLASDWGLKVLNPAVPS
jgi:predicted nucleic acid-binding protein